MIRDMRLTAFDRCWLVTWGMIAAAHFARVIS